MLHAVIMAGGSGTRFWPKSRRTHPKQFLPLVSGNTLLADTYQRCAGWIPANSWMVVTNHLLSEETQRQLPKLCSHQILSEPCGRNTAPCIAWAAMSLLRQDADAIMLVMPADHAILKIDKFREGVRRAVELVESEPDRLVLFGVPPTYPATGFGYIERGGSLEDEDIRAYSVRSFQEKPPLEQAQRFLSGKRHYWNCGIFVWRADRILALIRQLNPEIAARLNELAPLLNTEQEREALQRIFPQIPSISIDHAVLEKASDVVVMEASFDWDDVGSWQSVARLTGTDEQGNTVIGLHVGVETDHSIIHNYSERHLIATIGIRDCLIVHTPDATLIARRDDENAIRELVSLLEQQGYGSYL